MWQGGTENLEVCKGRLKDIARRRLPTEKNIYYI